MANKTNRVTIYQVAAEANVSLATVSRVINQTGNVNEETKFAVEQAIMRLGYVPSNVARGLAKSSTTSVCIVLPSPNYSYISSILSGMLDVCKIYGYSPLVYTYEDPEDAVRVVNMVISSHAEGIVIYNSELSAADLHRMLRIKLPMVLIGQDNYGDNALVDIGFSKELFRFLKKRIEHGLNKIVYLKDPTKDWHMVSTFEMVIKNAAMISDCDVETVSIKDSYNVIYDYYMKKFKEKAPNHELYVALRDSLAIAVLNAAIDSGYKVPQDLEILTVVGTKQSTMCRPKISSITVDLYEVGSISMRMLTKLLNGTLKDKNFNFTAEFVKRDSTLE